MILTLNGSNDDINQFKVRTHCIRYVVETFYGKGIENFLDNIQEAKIEA